MSAGAEIQPADPAARRLASAGAEIQPADPAARRLALTIVVVIGALGLVPIIWLRNTLDTISELRHTDPLEATRMMLAVSRLLGAATAVVCFATAIWLGWLGLRMKRAERFPLPNARVVRDTPVLTGAAARRQARIALVFASAVSSCRCSSCALHLCSPRGRVDRTGSTDELDCADELERTDESNSWESR
jgi:hypothetical protein